MVPQKKNKCIFIKFLEKYIHYLEKYSNDQYFEKVAAVEFTLNHDDGRNIKSLEECDVVLVGISRTSKTPLSIFLSLEGIKVVNIPIILNMPLPEKLFSIDQRKIFGLTIDPEALREIRKNRLSNLGTNASGDYAGIVHVHDLIKEGII